MRRRFVQLGHAGGYVLGALPFSTQRQYPENEGRRDEDPEAEHSQSLAKRYTSMVRYLWLAAALCAATLGSEPAASPYASRRAELRKALPDGVIVLFGRSEADIDDLRSGFFQEPNFYYLTGWSQPGAVLVLEPARDILFLPAKNPEAEKWTGVKASATDQDVRAAEPGRLLPVSHRGQGRSVGHGRHPADRSGLRAGDPLARHPPPSRSSRRFRGVRGASRRGLRDALSPGPRLECAD